MVNSYGSDKDEDHMDVDTVDTKNKLKEEAGAAEGDESADHEQPESDKEHDYEEHAPDANFIQTQFCLGNREETSDDDPDYENIFLSCDEIIVDVDGQDESIYQNL